MTGQMALRRVATAAVIALLATAVLLVWVIGVSRAEAVPLTTRVDQAAVGDPVVKVGTCFSDGYIYVDVDPQELSKQVRDKGRNARLAPDREAAPDARTLAERTKGELLGVDNGEAAVLYVEDGRRRVDTYTRYSSSEGDVVWIKTRTTTQIACGDD